MPYMTLRHPKSTPTTERYRRHGRRWHQEEREENKPEVGPHCSSHLPRPLPPFACYTAFIVVRPPPEKYNHPLSLWAQLVPPTIS
ncbi:hypothetical protein BC826DRAFT_241586 [Russula brevipes]|nr:hypothetical protein BC826DRAFT_241586 [Russula brevipes]